MNSKHPSRRPGSGRPSSRFNPITGEEIGLDNKVGGGLGSTSKIATSDGLAHRPSDVPALNLGRLLDDDVVSKPISLSIQPKSSNRSLQMDLATPPSASNSMRLGSPLQPKFVDASLSSKQQASATIPKGASTLLSLSIPNVKKLNAEEVDEEKRREKVIETVLLDQLSRALISQPDQDYRQDAAAASELYHQPGMPRGHIRKLHESKVLTRATPTEMLLSHRVRFGARVLTRVSQDALRELTGFFFVNDNTMTIYEYKQFGKSGKALPFIAKGTYCHPCGRRRGKPVTLADIVVGKNIVFSTSQQPALPVTLKEESTVLIRVTEVDEEAKQRIVLDGVRNSEKEAAWATLHGLTKEELHDKDIIERVQTKTRSSMKKRPIKAVAGFAALFRSKERPGGTVSKDELFAALDDFRIALSAEDFEDLWNAIDVDGNGVLTVHEAVRGLLGEMPEHRHVLVRKAFQKLDTGKQGIVPLSQLIKFFSAGKHPHVCSGVTSAVVHMESFLSHWNESTAVRGMVAYSEFEDYYEGLSTITDSDQEFEDILRGTWGL